MRENLDTGFILLWLHALRELLLSLRRHLLVAQAGCLLSICCSVAVSLRCRLAGVQEYNISFNRIYRATSLHGVSPFETFFVVELPNEPLDIDQPTRCPATEGCIMEDGLTWKETLAGTLYAQLSRRQWDGMKTTRESAHGPFHSRMQLSLGD